MTQQPSGQPSGCDPQDADDPPCGLFIGDIQALRRAEALRMHTDAATGIIDALLSDVGSDQPRIYTAKQQHLFPHVEDGQRRRRVHVPADIVGFDAQRRWHEHQLPGATALTVIGGAQFDDVWRGIAGFVRVGDVIGLRWRADNTTDQLSAHGLHRDELCITVRRGRRLCTFLLCVSVRPQDARMVTTTAPH